MIHIENLVKRYGDLVALNHLSLDIKEGEIFGLLGPHQTYPHPVPSRHNIW